MAAIRTREVNKGTIKSLDRAAGLADRVRVAGVKTKDQSPGALGKSEDSSESAYASDRSLRLVEDGTRSTGRVISGGGRKAKNIINSKRQIVDVKTKKKMVKGSSKVMEGGGKVASAAVSIRRKSYRVVARKGTIRTAHKVNAKKKNDKDKGGAQSASAKQKGRPAYCPRSKEDSNPYLPCIASGYLGNQSFGRSYYCRWLDIFDYHPDLHTLWCGILLLWR